MKTATAKAKGRRFQQKIATLLRDKFKLEDDDLVSRPMGSQGEDLMLSTAARKLLPFSFECKKHKAFGIYKHYEQATTNAGKYDPVLVVEADHKIPLVVISFEVFLKLVSKK